MCGLLLDHQADIESRDRRGRTPLWWAAYTGMDENCRLLLARGASAHSTDDDGCSVASAGAKGYGDQESKECIARLMLGCGARHIPGFVAEKAGSGEE
ncbi:hypothetical protein GGTG_07212 [Gaeumannomyces tritici R3-111a-1]|uniref:Uncharacterized protein n=1 Tax=Gaeumannomyces tritici (strain R3-111a-1) TaxID=644352 RepID=J3P115_GAET3|nr:hypothetical protein GGTG_07212 [Gaeumannomyces tritici R3-111a-1]EJT77300.1 hypothetical protein GGTG_07212 [Gaeumannomyces tritici R3-111a-1]